MTVIPFKRSFLLARHPPPLGPNTGIIKCKTNYFFLLQLHGAVVRLSQQGVKEDGLATYCTKLALTLPHLELLWFPGSVLDENY
jgi:hypothetical protein